MSLSATAPGLALTRFGLGARPDDEPPADPRHWLIAQFDAFDVRPAGFAALADAGALVRDYRIAQRDARQQAQMPPARPAVAPQTMTPTAAPAAAVDPAAMRQVIRQDYGQDAQALYRAAVQARTDSALTTPAPFVERMVHFWSNHFCVSTDNAEIAAYAGAFERDAIRPHVLGRFSDMLLAVERHPAMLLYLNQNNSIGPNSPAALRHPNTRQGLNENLAREIMELHTLGVRSGYAQADVTEFARALTGWTIDGIGGGRTETGDPNAFAFHAERHEPGARTLLGKRYDQAGEDQAHAALLDFAAAPATATHVATKLARHFAGDDPPPALVARLATTFARKDGDLPSLYRTLIKSPEPWAPARPKFKTPWDWTISALRGIGRTEAGKMQIASVQNQLGQGVWKPGSPAGWDDLAASWAAPDALLRRVEIAQSLAAPVGDHVDARALAPRLLPAALGSATTEQIARSESPAGALALLLVSPEFLRR